MPPHVSEITVRYAETDQMGVAHHSVYLVWFEVARTDLFSKMLGYSYRELESRGSRLPIIETGCRHLAAVGYDDKVYVEARIGEVRRTRFRVDYIARDAEGKVVAEGFTVLAHLNDKMRPERLPPDMEQAMRADMDGARTSRNPPGIRQSEK